MHLDNYDSESVEMTFQHPLDFVERKMTMSPTPTYKCPMVRGCIKLPMPCLQRGNTSGG